MQNYSSAFPAPKSRDRRGEARKIILNEKHTLYPHLKKTDESCVNLQLMFNSGQTSDRHMLTFLLSVKKNALLHDILIFCMTGVNDD